MEKNTFKKVLVLVFAVLMCAMSVICVSASESYANGRKYTYSYVSDNTTYSGIGVADRPADATVITHVYYVGGANGSDTNDGLTKEMPFKTITGAVAYAKKQGYLLDVDYTATELHEVKIVLLGDTVETPTATQINGKDDSGCLNIQGGILTIVPDDGVNAKVTIGTSTKTVKKNFFYMRAASKNTGKYIEVNLGAPNMNGTITFDGTYYDISENNGSNHYWGAFLRIGDESYTDVAVANMYDGVTIANIGYNEDTKAIVDTTSNGFVVQADCGTFNMYGGTITQNVCRSAIASYGRSGLGAYVYGGKITNNNSRVLYTAWDANAKIVVYDCLMQNNSSTAWGAIETSQERSTIILYGGKLLDNIGVGKDNNKAVNAQVYSGGYIYVSDKVEITNETFTGLDGNIYTAEKTYFVKNNNYKPLDMKSTVIYAKDGSAIGYGYVPSKQASGYYLKDRNIETTETLTLEKVAGYQLYKKPGTTSCADAISDGDAIYTGITPSADMTSAVYYYNSAKTHNESYEILTPATETTNGTGRYTCQDCEATRDVVIPATNHVHNYTATVTDPTCTEQGYTTHTCAGCGDSYVDTYVDALGHDYSGAGTVVTDPTCLESGYTICTCQREGCGYSITKDFTAALGHDYITEVIIEPTASSKGLNKYTCSRCDFLVERDTYIDPKTVDVNIKVKDGEEIKSFTVKLNTVCNCNYTAPSPTASYALALSSFRSFTVDGVACSISNIVEISIPFGVLKVNGSDSLFNNNKVIEKVDFSASDGVTIYGFQNATALKEVVFGSNMTIGNDAFKGDTALENIVFGNNITIGDKAFLGCTAIEKLDFSTSDGVTIRYNAFEEASKLKNIVFGDNMTILGSAFKNCDALTEIVVGDGLKVNFAGEWVFNGCDNILSAEFGASNITFGKNSFRTTSDNSKYTPLKSVKFSDGGTYTLGEKAFAFCSMTEVVFPDRAEVITENDSTDAFWRCDKITYVYLGEGTKNAAKLFYNCSGLQKAVLVGPEKIGKHCFAVGTATGEDVGVLKVYIHNKDCSIGEYAFEKRSGIQVYTMAPITTSNAFNNCAATKKKVNGEDVSYPKYTIYYGIPHEYTAHTFAPTCTTEGYDGYITSCPHCGENIEPEYPTTYKVFVGVLTNSATFTEKTLAKTNIVEKIAHTAGNVVRITYANGFDKVGAYVRVCTVCANNYDAESADAIFAALGYSIKDTSTDSKNNAIYGGFTVNTAALAEYNSYTTTPLKYGIIISNVTGANNISFTGNIIDGKSIQVEINDTSFTRFGFTLTGFDSDTAKALNIVISAYVIDEEGNMSFVQRTESYSKTVTVNSVVASTLGAVTFADVDKWTTKASVA